MQFGIYLVDQQLITAGQFVDAVRQQLSQRVPLGQLAIERGKLSVRQVYEILRSQANSECDRFGETAIDLGMLTATDVAELLMVQADRRPKLSHLLVQSGVLTREQCDEALAAFRRQAERQSPTTMTHRHLPSLRDTTVETQPELVASGV